jgi:HK97 family phage major capsid protein
MFAKVRAAKDDIRKADGAIKALREAEAEDDEAQRASLQVREWAPAPGGTRTVDASTGTVARDSTNGPRWVRCDDGRPATVEHGQRWADNAIVREQTERVAERDRLIMGQYGDLGMYIRSLSTTGASGVVPQAWANEVFDLARNNAAVLQAGAQLVPMDRKVVNIGRLTADPTAAFRAEGGTITASDPSFDSVVLTAKTPGPRQSRS